VAINAALLPEFDHEMAVTRRLLERVPGGEFGWKPHDKSYSLGQLATHIANLPTFAGYILSAPSLDVAAIPEGARPTVPSSTAELVARFDKNVKDARAALASKTDAEYMALWTLKKASETVFTMPKISALRSFVMNHSIHHRGQLSVYLRLRNVPLPAMYGPTADEGAF
jgi:uncharacterized damage-inducible protein DinB